MMASAGPVQIEVSDDAKKRTTSSSPPDVDVDLRCPICLGEMNDQTFLDLCFHRFCFLCIMKWGQMKRSCPLCKMQFRSLIHNVKSVYQYDQVELKEIPTQRDGVQRWQFSETMSDGRRFRYRTTQVGDIERSPDDSVGQDVIEASAPSSSVPSSSAQPLAPSRLSVRHRRQAAGEERRRLVYFSSMTAQLPRQARRRRRDISAAFFRSNPAATHRLVPWIRRDLKVLLRDENDVKFVADSIMRIIPRVDVKSSAFTSELVSFLGSQTERFVDELVHFAESPFDITGYDSACVYSGGSQSVSTEADVGIPGSSRQHLQQAIFDELTVSSGWETPPLTASGFGEVHTAGADAWSLGSPSSDVEITHVVNATNHNYLVIDLDSSSDADLPGMGDNEQTIQPVTTCANISEVTQTRTASGEVGPSRQGAHSGQRRKAGAGSRKHRSTRSPSSSRSSSLSSPRQRRSHKNADTRSTAEREHRHQAHSSDHHGNKERPRYKEHHHDKGRSKYKDCHRDKERPRCKDHGKHQTSRDQIRHHESDHKDHRTRRHLADRGKHRYQHKDRKESRNTSSHCNRYDKKRYHQNDLPDREYRGNGRGSRDHSPSAEMSAHYDSHARYRDYRRRSVKEHHGRGFWVSPDSRHGRVLYDTSHARSETRHQLDGGRAQTSSRRPLLSSVVIVPPAVHKVSTNENQAEISWLEQQQKALESELKGHRKQALNVLTQLETKHRVEEPADDIDKLHREYEELERNISMAKKALLHVMGKLEQLGPALESGSASHRLLL